MKKFLALIPLVLLISGCPKDPYRASIQGSSDVEQAIHSAIALTAQYYTAGTFSDGQKATAAHYLDAVSSCNSTFRASAVASHNAGQTGVTIYLAEADSLVQCVQSTPLVADPKVKSALQAVDTALNGVSLAIASAKGAK